MAVQLWRTPGEYIAEGRDLWAEIKPLIAQGIGVTELAQRFSIKRLTMANFIYKMKKRDEKGADADQKRGRAGAVKKAARERYGKAPDELFTEWISDETVNGAVMAERLGVDITAVNYWLKKLGLPLSLQESRRRAKLAGRYDQDKAIANSRRTMLKNAFVAGSGAAQTIGRLLKADLLQTPLPNWDVIIGENAWHVIEPAEVDIPVVVIRRNVMTWGRIAYTFAIEVDGETWHEERKVRDSAKDERLAGAGWMPIRVSLRENYTDTELETEVRNIMKIIRQEISVVTRTLL